MSQIAAASPRVLPTAGASGISKKADARAWWRLLLKDRAAVCALVVLALLTLAAIFAPWLAPDDPLATDTRAKAVPMFSPGHLLGTDQVGRDILSRLLYGGRLTLAIGLIGATLAATAGLIIGAVAGYFGGRIDTLTMRAIDVLLAFPDILLAIVIVAILGPSLQNALLAVIILGIPFYVRLVRADVMTQRASDYVLAARTLGADHRAIIFRHIMPNVFAPVLVTASVHIGYLILAAAGLSFIGLGAQPPSPEWGAMVSSGRDYLLIEPHIVLIPSVAIFVVVLAFNIAGDGLRDALDPRAR